MGLIEKRIEENIEIKKKILQDTALLRHIQTAAETIGEALTKGGKLLFCGNGGSASDALHLAGEFVGRFQKERGAFPALALNADVAAMTSIANDYGFDKVFSRMITGLMNPEDILVGISTSGNSENVYQAMLTAGKIGKTIAFLGKDGGKIKMAADIPLVVPDGCTARIQESHILIGHIICEIAEEGRRC